MPKVDRREFMKLVGAGGVGAGAGIMLSESTKHPVEHLIPYPVPPEEFSPGIATWYNSVCGMCPAGCGITVRTREGRAKKIEGNPSHPVNQGRLCALGQAGLQLLYNPDRVVAPMLQSGARGSDGFVQTTWNDALSRVATRIEQARADGARVVCLSRGERGRLGSLMETFLAELGNADLLFHDFAHPHALYAANQRLFGVDELPYFDIRNTRYLLSFGADYLNNWLSPVHYGGAYGHSRQGEAGHRGHFVQIEPRMSLSGAAADEWLPARPGTEGLLALAIAHELVASGAYAGDDLAAWRSALDGFAPAAVAARADIAATTITRIAGEFADADAALAIAGGAAANHTNGVDTIVAVNTLNLLAGSIGRRGGIIFNPQPAAGGSGHSRQSSYLTLAELLNDARNGDIEVLIVNNTNPAFSLPPAAAFDEALEAIPFVVSIASLLDETAATADIVLANHTYLESWGDDSPQPGVGFSVAAVSQPVVSPLYNTRSTGDIFLGLAARLGLRESLPWDSMEACLRDGWREIHQGTAPPGDDFDTFWRDVLRAGVWGQNTRADESPVSGPQVLAELGVSEAEFGGAAGDYPFVLHAYLSTAMFDGRGANLPWMQELPDPMTSVVYGSWVEMNPATAADLGLADGDLVRVSSEQGSIEVPLVSYPAIRPDVVAIPIGQGHTALGRYARNRGANPMRLLAPLTDDATGGLALAATRVRLTATGRRAAPVRTGGESRQLGRSIVQFTGNGGSAGHSASLNSIPIVVESA